MVAEQLLNLEEAIIEVKTYHTAPGVHDPDLTVLHRAPHPVLHISTCSCDELPYMVKLASYAAAKLSIGCHHPHCDLRHCREVHARQGRPSASLSSKRPAQDNCIEEEDAPVWQHEQGPQ